jgi:hypothetical protein
MNRAMKPTEEVTVTVTVTLDDEREKSVTAEIPHAWMRQYAAESAESLTLALLAEEAAEQ